MRDPLSRRTVKRNRSQRLYCSHLWQSTARFHELVKAAKQLPFSSICTECIVTGDPFRFTIPPSIPLETEERKKKQIACAFRNVNTIYCMIRNSVVSSGQVQTVKCKYSHTHTHILAPNLHIIRRILSTPCHCT